ncbi:MAG: pyridoxamine 5'-phosphate oxidase family protein [Sphaerochaetaceae bacterium]
MRRKDKEQTTEFAYTVLDEAEYGVLALADKTGNTYAVPISFTRIGTKIYIHGANEGRKLSLINENSKVSFTAVSYTKLLPDIFSTDYKSAIVSGIASIVENQSEKLEALKAFAVKYSHNFLKEGDKYIDAQWDNTTLIVIDIENISGKAQLPK